MSAGASAARVVIVGAGLSGLMAARRLGTEGVDVIVVDKGRSPGGRLATRRLRRPDDDAIAHLDHGAQFFTVRSDRFAAVVDGWCAAGVARTWCHGFGHTDGHPRYVGHEGMNGIAKHLARDLDVRVDHLAVGIRRGAGGRAWSVELDGGAELAADALVLTTPLPQAFTLLAGADVALPERLVRTEYDRTIALLAVLDDRGGVPPPGGVQDGDVIFSFIGDNEAKGVSSVPAITFHTNAAWSDEHWDDEPDALHSRLVTLAQPWLGDASIVTSQVKRWRYATPRSVWPEPCWVDDDGPGTLVLAGDAFGGPKMEGAALSGLAAAAALLG